MFNVTVLDGKKLLKCISIVMIIAIISIFLNTTKKNNYLIEPMQDIANKICSHSYINAIELNILSAKNNDDIGKIQQELTNTSIVSNILNSELNIKNSIVAKENKIDEEEVYTTEPEITVQNTVPTILDNIVPDVINENNLKASIADSYKNVQIKNKSGCTVTDDMLIPDVALDNKKDIIIFHTHTCESYTPTEQYNYQMTGNYRTTDLNYSVARVGTELTNMLQSKGYNVIHNTTYHDYPSYTGSYNRSVETVSNILANSNAQLVLDIHRDAVGDGTEYGPTVEINNEVAAQLMIVVGTDGGGLYHPNWRENLKIAIKLQTIGNELYPGLFLPIHLSSSRYNQNLTNGSLIIEVGATANTMEECLVSMKYLANAIDETMKI